MKKQSKQIRRFLFVLFLIVGISTFSSMRINATTVSYDPPTYSSLIPHDPISINQDTDFLAFPGAGTVEDPYLIDGYNITASTEYGIFISSTTKFFIVRNCYIDAEDYGIYIYEVASGTATIINNTCTNNNGYGIFITTSRYSTVANNTCNNNSYGGIHIENTSYFIVTNNTCNNNGVGIELWFTSSSTVANNTFNNNGRAISLYDSVSLTVLNNKCKNNGDIGINFWNSDSCIITYNLLQESAYPGMYLYPNCADNIIHHNSFVDTNLVEIYGTSQAFDDGTNNFWYDTVTLEGNYWSDWLGTGNYSIDGSADSEDLYPLDEPVDIDSPLIDEIIHSPVTPTDLDTININATVTDDSGIHNVTLHYKINSGTWTEVSMTLISVDIYSVTIGPFAVGDTVEYYVSAVDNSANYNEAIDNNSGEYYSFTVSEVVPEFQMFSPLLPTLTFLFLVCGLVVLQRRKK